MPQSDWTEAFKSLTEAIRGIQIGNSIEKAREAAKAVRNNQKLNEFEAIEQQQAIANDAAASILSLGGTAEHAQQARLGIAPEMPNAQMALMKATGKGTVAEAAKFLKEESATQELAQKEKVLKLENKFKLEEIKAKGIADRELFGTKAASRASQPSRLTPNQLKDLNASATRAENYLELSKKAAALGSKMLLPEQVGSAELAEFERYKAMSDAELRTELFGASLTPAEASTFKQIIGSLGKSGFRSDIYAQGLAMLGKINRNKYTKSLEGLAANNHGGPEALLRHLYTRRSLFNADDKEDQERLVNLAKNIKFTAHGEMSQIEAAIGLGTQSPATPATPVVDGQQNAPQQSESIFSQPGQPPQTNIKTSLRKYMRPSSR